MMQAIGEHVMNQGCVNLATTVLPQLRATFQDNSTIGNNSSDHVGQPPPAVIVPFVHEYHRTANRTDRFAGDGWGVFVCLDETKKKVSITYDTRRYYTHTVYRLDQGSTDPSLGIISRDTRHHLCVTACIGYPVTTVDEGIYAWRASLLSFNQPLKQWTPNDVSSRWTGRTRLQLY